MEPPHHVKVIHFLKFDNCVPLKKTALSTSCLESRKDTSVLITISSNNHEDLTEVIFGKVTLSGVQVGVEPNNCLRSVEVSVMALRTSVCSF
jgi:hypothetical protein